MYDKSKRIIAYVKVKLRVKVKLKNYCIKNSQEITILHDKSYIIIVQFYFKIDTDPYEPLNGYLDSCSLPSCNI